MFKKFLLSGLILFFLAACGPKSTNNPTPSQDQLKLEEQAVYAAALKDLYTATSFVIMENTSTDPGGTGNTASSVDYVMKNLRDADERLAEDFRSRNDQPYPLASDMDLGVKYVLLSQSERNKIFDQNASGWENFYKNYPNTPGITDISRVGFNPTFDQALVYVGTQSYYLAGAGYYLLLLKVNGTWTVSQKVMTWIS